MAPKKSRAKSGKGGVRQPHGGTLVPGAGKGPAKGAPNAGRPPNELRALLRLSITDRMPMLAAVMDGDVVQRTRIPLLSITPHIECDDCGGKNIKPSMAIEDALFIEIEGTTSASIANRLSAWDMSAKYGLGALKSVSVDEVRERVQQMLDLAKSLMSPEQYAMFAKRSAPIWGSGPA